MNHILIISLKNIIRNPRKSVLIGIVIFIANIVFFLTFSLSSNVRLCWRDYFSSTFTGVYNVTAYKGLERDYTIPPVNLPENAIPDQFFEFIRNEGIDYCSRLKIGALVYNFEKREFQGQPATIVGIDIKKELNLLHNLTIKQGRYDQEIKNGILVLDEYAALFGWKAGDKIVCAARSVQNKTELISFSVMGIISQKARAGFEGKGELLVAPIIFAEMSYVSQKLGRIDIPTDLVFRDNSKSEIVMRQATLDNLQFFYAEKGFNVVYGIVEFIELMGIIIESFILFIFLVATVNIQMMSYIERRKEIGTLLALGTPGSHIFALVFLELVFFASIVFVLSIIGYLLFTTIFSSGIDFGELAVIFARKNFIPSLIPVSVPVAYCAVLVALVLASAYPGYLAIRTDPVQVLRESVL